MTAPDLETAILLLVAEHVEAAATQCERVDILPVVAAIAKALGQTIASADDPVHRLALLIVAKNALAAELIDAAEERAMARPGDRVTVGRMN